MSEVVRLGTGERAPLSRKGVLRIYGKGGKVREVPIHAKLRRGLEHCRLTERAAWPGADTSPALFLNTKAGKTDLVVVAELMGHSRLDTTRQYSLPTVMTKPTPLTT